MTLSIVIPVYNVEPFLREGINSVTNQSYQDLDIICVNDGSTDNGLEILNEFAKADKRIRVFSQENSGTYIARQVGVSKAIGEYILFFDPDDWLDLHTCEIIASFINTNDADIIQYGINIDSTIEGSVTAEWLNSWLNSEINSLKGSNSLWEKSFIEQKIAWNLIGKVVRTSVAKQAFNAQGKYCFSTLTDYFAAFYVFAYADTYLRLNQRLYHYRHGVGVSSKKDVTIDDFQKSIRNFKGLADLHDFVNRNAQFIGETGCRIALNDMKDYTVNNAIFFALNRLPRTIDPAEWLSLLSQETDPTNILKATVHHYYAVKDSLSNLQQQIRETNESIHRLQSEKDVILKELDKISAKNQKHLRQLRVCIIICSLTIISIIIAIIFSL